MHRLGDHPFETHDIPPMRVFQEAIEPFQVARRHAPHFVAHRLLTTAHGKDAAVRPPDFIKWIKRLKRHVFAKIPPAVGP